MTYVEQGKDKYIKLSQALEALDSCSCWWAHDRMECIPAADVRPVILCRDCKYAPVGDRDGNDLEWPCNDWPDRNPCPCKCEDNWHSQKPAPDFFCAAGEKREES